jgi:exodeoxyribonuclease-1
MPQTFYWYDYETWGLNPSYARPAQFAGIRTDLNFKPIGEPLVIYNKPTDDMLPEPDAVMITGITPQHALQEGLSEHEFAKAIHNELSKPDTISLGYNTRRFDESFNRYLFWRNFFDPYEHGWKDGASCWDIIDVVRLTRALRPDGISWPEENGKPTNRLEKLTEANNIEHAGAHDALVDVKATIALAQLVKTAQPKLFDYAFTHRDKRSVEELLNTESMTPIVHASDKYGSEVLSTALVTPVARIEEGRQVLVFDLKTNPQAILDMTSEEIADNLFTPYRELPEETERIGVKAIKLNSSPVLAPAGTLDDTAAERIKLDREVAERNLAFIKKNRDEIITKLVEAHKRDWPRLTGSGQKFVDAESKLYDGFVSDGDKRLFEKVRAGEFDVNFKDERLQDLLTHYKARNFPALLTEAERGEWESYRNERLNKSPMNFQTYAARLQSLATDTSLNDAQRNLLEDLQLYAESIYPYDE